MREAMQWVHDRTVEGMNVDTDVHTLDAGGPGPRAPRCGRGLRQDQLERAGHLGELRRLVPPPVHHRALRRAPGGHRPRPGGRRPGPTPWPWPPGPGSMPANRWPPCTSPTSSWPSSPATPRRGPAAAGRHPPAARRQRQLLGTGLAAPVARTDWRPDEQRPLVRLPRSVGRGHRRHQRHRARSGHRLRCCRGRRDRHRHPGRPPTSTTPTSARSPTGRWR